MQVHHVKCVVARQLPSLSSLSAGTLRTARRARVLAGAVLLACLGIADLAAQAPDLTQKSLEDLMNIDVTSVSKKAQKTSQAAAAIFVITPEDIRRSGALNIPDLLRMVPGLDVAQIDGSQWAISARGFNGQYSNKLLVLIDGRTVYNPAFVNVFWDSQNVPLESIERIEVIRGPGAAVWGSNAVNGVINIITNSAEKTQGGTVSGGGGNAATGPETIRYGGKARKIGAYRVYAEGFHNNSLFTPAGLDGQDDWRLVHGGFRTDSTPNARDSVTTEGDIAEGDAGELTTVPISIEPPENATLALRNRYSEWNLLGRWNRRISPGSETSLQVYFDRIVRGDSTYNLGLNSLDIDFQHHVGWGARQDIVWGLGYRVSSDGTNPTLRIVFTPKKKLTQLFSLFAQDEITICPERLRLSFGARFEHNGYTGFDIEPSVRLAWTPNSKNMLWSAISGAVRIPGRYNTDLRANFSTLPGPGGMPMLISMFGNPQEKDERLTGFDAGYRNTWTSNLSLDSTVFYNRYRDLESVGLGTAVVEMNPSPPHLLIPNTFGNGLYGETHGMEVFANWKASRFWTLSPGYAFMTMHLHAFPGSHDATTIPGTEGSSPDHQAQLRSSISLPMKLQWNASGAFVDRLPALSISAYTRVDTGLTWQPGGSFSLRACLRSSEQQPEKRQVDHLQAGIQFAFAVLP